MTSARIRQKPSAPRSIGAGNDNAPLVANDNRPSVILLGDLPVLSRHPIDRLSPGELGRINRIEAALRGRNKREASRLALDYETSQGITTEERIAAMAPANDVDRLIEAALGFAVQTYAEGYVAPKPVREKKLKGKKKPKAKKVDPYEGFPIGDLRQDEIDQVEAAEANLKAPDLAVRKAAMETMARVRRAVETRINKQAVTEGLEDIIALEAARGVKVEKSKNPDHAGGMFVPGRDGLETLTAEKTDKDGEPIPPTLSRIQFAAGLRYRKDYEMIDPARILTPMELGGSTKGASHGGDGWSDKRLEIERRLWSVHALIAGLPYGARSMPPLPAGHLVMRAIHAIVEIAGKGSNPSEMTNSGGARERIVASLKFALDCAASIYDLADPDAAP